MDVCCQLVTHWMLSVSQVHLAPNTELLTGLVAVQYSVVVCRLVSAIYLFPLVLLLLVKSDFLLAL